MMLVRYGQAAMIAAIMVLTGNAVRAQDSEGCTIIGKMVRCCKEGKCCKEGGCCSQNKKCEAKSTCCKDNKRACCKDGESCCDKNGKSTCCKDKTSAVKTGYGCPFLSKLAKRTAIILVMPASMPLPCCMEAMGILPHPPMPMPGPHVFLPPMPPIPPIPPTPSMAMPFMPLDCAPCPPYGNTVWAAGPPTPAPCITTKELTVAAPRYICTATADAKVRGETAENNDRLVMCVGEGACIRAKKMTISFGDNEITLSRFDDRVRVRGEELKATANCVRTDGKDRLILEGDVVMHYKKDGRTVANVMTGEHIELNLSSGAVTIKSSGKASSSPAVHIERVDSESK